LSEFLTDHGVVVALVCAGVADRVWRADRALAARRSRRATSRCVAIFQRRPGGCARLPQPPVHDDRDRRVVLAVALIFIQDGYVALGFAIGGILSGAAATSA